ncbi:MAG: alpha/beta fold hydrolase [Candidatus Micrarchaeia archaeon]
MVKELLKKIKLGKSKNNSKKKQHKIKHIIKNIREKISSKIPKIKNLKEKKILNQIKLSKGISPKQFEVITPDGVDIKLNFYDTPNTDKGIILLPVLGKTKESMDGLAQFVCKLGYKAVAVDYRGHGGSALNWQSFRSKDFANMVYDAKAAKEFLAAHKTKTIGIIGASIGANVALNYLAMDPQIKTAILLSPGIDYRGVKIDYSIPDIKVPIFIFASKGDQYSFVSTQHIQKLCGSPNICVDFLDGEMHGMELLSDRKTRNYILNKIEAWLKQYVR